MFIRLTAPDGRLLRVNVNYIESYFEDFQGSNVIAFTGCDTAMSVKETPAEMDKILAELGVIK